MTTLHVGIVESHPIYFVQVNGELYDWFQSFERLTWSQETDVVAGYREALSGYVLGDTE